jgi:hypothetical protein
VWLQSKHHHCSRISGIPSLAMAKYCYKTLPFICFFNNGTRFHPLPPFHPFYFILFYNLCEVRYRPVICTRWHRRDLPGPCCICTCPSRDVACMLKQTFARGETRNDWTRGRIWPGAQRTAYRIITTTKVPKIKSIRRYCWMSKIYGRSFNLTWGVI